MNLKVFMANNAHANWNAVIRIYSVGDPNLPMMDHKHIYFFHWSHSFDKVMNKYIKASLWFQHK